MPELRVFYQPETVSEAVNILAEFKGRLEPLAGGTDVLVALRRGEFKADGLLDLSRIKELKRIQLSDQELRLGSLCTFSQVQNAVSVREHAPLLAEGAGSVGSPQIRNGGTIGGNIANASPAADSVTALVALDAEATLVSAGGSRTILVSDLLCGVGKTHIGHQEIITEIRFALPGKASRSGFVKLGRRKALAIARMNMAMIIEEQAGQISLARVSLGAVGPNPSRSTSLEQFLIGQKPSPALVDDFAREAGLEVARMLGARASAGYKKESIKGIARELATRLFIGNGEVVAQ